MYEFKPEDGRKGGKKSFKLHGSPATFESCQKGGRIRAESGELPFIGSTESRRRGGETQGLKSFEEKSGIFSPGRINFESRSLGGSIACHVRHHLNLGIRNPKCLLCLDLLEAERKVAEEHYF
jgi:hypothetical protein